MVKNFADPFAESETNIDVIVPKVEPVSEELPERGTGIENGNADERKGDKPRSDEERKERHNAVVTPIEIQMPKPMPLTFQEKRARYRSI